MEGIKSRILNTWVNILLTLELEAPCTKEKKNQIKNHLYMSYVYCLIEVMIFKG